VFNHISLRSVKANIKINAWSGAIGANAELEEAWFRVRSIPYDQRSMPTMGYVGSLVGMIRDVDKCTLHRADYVRIKIVAREVARVLEVIEGSIGKYLYDFNFEREIEMGQAAKAIEIKVIAGKGGEAQPYLKKPRTDQGEKRDTSTLQIELFSSKEASESGQVSRQPVYEKDGVSKEVDKATHLLIGLSSIDELAEMDDQNFKHSFNKNEAKEDSWPNRDDRVQGLSGNHLTSSEDDVGFEEGQASQIDKQIDQSLHNPESGVMDVVEKSCKDRVVNVEENILGKGSGESNKKEAEVDEGSMGNSESDQASENLPNLMTST
jgi:hypothetical protein